MHASSGLNSSSTRERSGLGCRGVVCACALVARRPQPSPLTTPTPLPPNPQAFLVAQLEAGVLTDGHLAAAFLGPEGFVAGLADLAEDVPKAPPLTGAMLGDFAAAGRLALRPVVDAALAERPRGGEEGEDGEGGGDDPPLVDAEQALPLVAALLNRWREVAGDDGAAAKAAWAAAELEWGQLLPSFAREPADVAKALSKHGAEWLA
jgi:hypothetical protein